MYAKGLMEKAKTRPKPKKRRFQLCKGCRLQKVLRFSNISEI
jgi:hypothetical protein